MCTCAPRDWWGLLLQDVAASLSPAANPASFVHAGRGWHQCQHLQPMGQLGGVCSLQPDDNFHTTGVPLLLNQSDGGVGELGDVICLPLFFLSLNFSFNFIYKCMCKAWDGLCTETQSLTNQHWQEKLLLTGKKPPWPGSKSFTATVWL